MLKPPENGRKCKIDITNNCHLYRSPFLDYELNFTADHIF